MWTLLRKIIFLIPAEFTHTLAKTFILGFHRLSLRKRTYPLAPITGDNWLSTLNPIGLAAGFDKNAEILEALPHFGFGFAEIGTITPRAQPGNDLPRLFRDAENRNLFNRMGFNNCGAEAIAERLKKVKPTLPQGFKVGVNLGKNKDTPDERAEEDYASVARTFLTLADYFVINVSSPNTPGLRALQTPERLTAIVRKVQAEFEALPKNSSTISTVKPPLLVKLAPEITGEALKSIIEALIQTKIDGFVLTNTVQGTYIYRQREFSGGYSGQILTSTALERLKEVRRYTTLPILSVGGIFTAQDAMERLRAGASAVQLYTGWVYGGPLLIRKMIREMKLASANSARQELTKNP